MPDLGQAGGDNHQPLLISPFLGSLYRFPSFQFQQVNLSQEN